jgi:hypothetical protein
MKVVIGPVHRKVALIGKPYLSKTRGGNQHALSSGRMLNRQILYA